MHDGQILEHVTQRCEGFTGSQEVNEKIPTDFDNASSEPTFPNSRQDLGFHCNFCEAGIILKSEKCDKGCITVFPVQEKVKWVLWIYCNELCFKSNTSFRCAARAWTSSSLSIFISNSSLLAARVLL